jgi:hypothetical protein
MYNDIKRLELKNIKLKFNWNAVWKKLLQITYYVKNKYIARIKGKWIYFRSIYYLKLIRVSFWSFLMLSFQEHKSYFYKFYLSKRIITSQLANEVVISCFSLFPIAVSFGFSKGGLD